MSLGLGHPVSLRHQQLSYQGMRAAVIQEFEISITTISGDQYLVRTENVAKGVQLAEEKVRWPVAQWLAQSRVLMHDPLLGLLQGQSRHTLPTRAGQSGQRPDSPESAEAATLVQLGQTLHNQLFQGQLHDSWVTAQGVAQNRQDLLRLRIGMKDSRLQQLPWEALHAGSRPLATGTDVIFSRYILDRRQGHSAPIKASDSGQVLRILMVIAAPDDQERLELKQEVYHLQSELHPAAADADDAPLDVQLTILEQPGRAELTQELDRGNYQVLHYAGHSNLGNAGGDLYLVSRQTGLTERLSGEDLAGLLVNNGIRLAVFNSCRGGYSVDAQQGWQERNLAQALVKRGVPGVIAMTERIPDHVAITFTQLLYRNLKKGQSVDLSLNRTRQGLISAYGSHQFYWALPTLYMQPSYDGYLVKTAGHNENTGMLASASDLFSSLFAELGPARTDSPVPRRTLPGKTGAVTRSENLENEEDNAAVSTPARVVDDTVRLEDSVSAGQNSSPLASQDTDGELLVPADLKASNGFYGDEVTALSAVPAVTSPTDKPGNAAAPYKVGERLQRSHTLHPQFWTVSGIALVILAVLLGSAVVWRQQSFQASGPALSPLSELGLPAQVEVALNQGDLDAAAAASKALIDKGEYAAAIAALDTADERQQTDVIVSFLRGSAQWGLVKQGSPDFAPADARRSWMASLDQEPDWMEIAMALGFAHYAVGQEQSALEMWQRAIALAEQQPEARNIYFSDKPASEYVLNAYAGLAMVSLSLAKIEANPNERNRLIAQASAAYRQVMSEAPADFRVNTLGQNWLWLGGAIADWENAKTELSQLAE